MTMLDITFKPRNAFDRGDLLSPLLFNIIADMLDILINKAKEDEKVSGVVPHPTAIYPTICFFRAQWGKTPHLFFCINMMKTGTKLQVHEGCKRELAKLKMKNYRNIKLYSLTKD